MAVHKGEPGNWHLAFPEDLNPNTARHLQIMNIFGVDQLVVYFNKAIVLYNLASHEKKIVRIGGRIVGALVLTDTFLIVDSSGVFYEIESAKVLAAEPLPNFASSREETIYMTSFAGGFFTVEKENETCFLNLQWTKHKKNAQIEIPISDPMKVNQASCVITVCNCSDLGPTLVSRFLPNKPSGKSYLHDQIAFITVGNGDLYYLIVPRKRKVDENLDFQFLFKCDLHPIIGIFCHKETDIGKCTSIALLQRNGVMQSLTYLGHANELTVMSSYLPCVVHCYALTSHGTVLCSDTTTLWESLISRTDHLDKPFPYYKMFATRRIHLMAAYSDQFAVIVLTKRGKFHMLALDSSPTVPLDESEVLADIDRTNERLNEIQSYLLANREAIWARCIAKRAKSLKSKLVMTTKVTQEEILVHGVAVVNDAAFAYNEKGDYLLSINLVNKSNIKLSAKHWSIQLEFKKFGCDLVELMNINLFGDLGNHPLKMHHKFRMGNRSDLTIKCKLISRLLPDNSLEFLVVKSSAVQLNCSHFFRHTEEMKIFEPASDDLLNVQDMILKVMEEKNSRCKIITMQRREIYHISEHSYVVLLPAGLTHSQVWLKLLENSICHFPSTIAEKMKSKAQSPLKQCLKVLVGKYLVRFKLDGACSMLTIKCHNIVLLHGAKDVALAMLAQLATTRLTKDAIRKIKMDKEEDFIVFLNCNRNISLAEAVQVWRKSFSLYIPL